MKKKPIIALDISSNLRGGPYIATKNIINSELNKKYDFREIEYYNGLGRFISFKRILNLKRQISSIKPDAIIITGLQLSCFHVCVAAFLAGVKSRIITIHGSSMEAIGFSKIKQAILYGIELISLALCTSFYGVSKYASTLSASKWFKRKNRGFVYNIPTKKNKIKKITRSNIGLNENDLIISSSGRITKEKGFHILTETIKRINRDNVKFIIIGDGEYLCQMQDQLKSEIKNKKVIFTGFTENVYSYLSISDIFVLPTLHETLSVSLLEAAESSLPLISSNVGGVPEVISDNDNGLLVNPNSVDELSKAISILIENPENRKKMGERSKKRVKEIFNIDKSLKALAEIIDRELENHEKN